MKLTKRYGNKWTINEILSLQREYELLEWTVDQIAEKHERTVLAIVSKLESEGLIDSWVNARGYNDSDYLNGIMYDQEVHDEYEDEEVHDEYEDEDYEDDEEDDDYEDVGQNDELENNVSQLTQRVWSLETSVSEIGTMVKQIFSIFSSKPKEELTTENL